MWELDHKEGWESKNWCFYLWCWRRPLRVPWTARRSNQSILKDISPGYSLEGLMLELKCQYLGHLMWWTDTLEKPDAGKDWRQEKGTADEMVGWHYRLNGHEFEQALGDGEGQGAWCAAVPGVTKSWTHWETEQQQIQRIKLVLASAFRL